MKLKDFLDYMATKPKINGNSEVYNMFHKLAQDALKITTELNNKYHSEKEIIAIFSKLTGKQIDSSFKLFPPFYTECGKNITIGKNVFINACCKFQDQGGISIDDGCLIGHNVTIATINHDFNPKNRIAMEVKPVKIGKNVWIGSNSTILPGITIEDGAIIGAGSVVTKDVAKNTIVAGNPAKIKKVIEITEDIKAWKKELIY